MHAAELMGFDALKMEKLKRQADLNGHGIHYAS